MTDLGVPAGKGKVAIVTGGARGIGRAIVLRLAKLGCHVAFNYLHSEAQAKSLEAAARKMGVKCTGAKVDIKDFEAVGKWIQETKAEFGGLDILVNNAGIVKDKPLMLMAKDDWQDVINTNLNGMFNAARACIVTFMKQKSGRIINISSVSGVIGLPGQTNYSATKGAMNAFTKSLAKEVADYGIHVNAIAPGFIDTEILSHFPEQKRREVIEQIPLQRMGTCEDVANCVEFLLSEDANYITGQVIQVDGGLAMR